MVAAQAVAVKGAVLAVRQEAAIGEQREVMRERGRGDAKLPAHVGAGEFVVARQQLHDQQARRLAEGAVHLHHRAVVGGDGGDCASVR